MNIPSGTIHPVIKIYNKIWLKEIKKKLKVIPKTLKNLKTLPKNAKNIKILLKISKFHKQTTKFPKNAKNIKILLKISKFHKNAKNIKILQKISKFHKKLCFIIFQIRSVAVATRCQDMQRFDRAVFTVAGNFTIFDDFPTPFSNLPFSNLLFFNFFGQFFPPFEFSVFIREKIPFLLLFLFIIFYLLFIYRSRGIFAKFRTALIFYIF